MKASAIAHSNIALCKYWGKRNEELILPFNANISMTLNKFFTHTTLEFDKKYDKDILVINDKEYANETKEYKLYVGRFLRVVRERVNTDLYARIVSNNNFPLAAGLASSASGFAALAIAVNEIFNLSLDKNGLSILARQGSGSAARSIHGGFVEWLKGENENGEDSYAKQVFDENYWPEFRMIACITSTEEKKYKSRPSMQMSVETSPYFKQWAEGSDEDVQKVKQGLREKDFTLVGTTAEHSCMKMNGVMWTTKPAIIYQNQTTIELMHAIMQWREEGLESYYTMDAGPQVKILCLEKDVDVLVEKLSKFDGVEKVVVNKPGYDAKVVSEHLF
ncbi:diphosphomevalonate decarboxylase [Candidatus Woesearchaeota archaeon]|jgi:diphosphomevalonate decarboxylase|nr:diphosphomevalonate decarboxylase [Candidatus Woesearchaeota archaeon]